MFLHTVCSELESHDSPWMAAMALFCSLTPVTVAILEALHYQNFHSPKGCCIKRSTTFGRIWINAINKHLAELDLHARLQLVHACMPRDTLIVNKVNKLYTYYSLINGNTQWIRDQHFFGVRIF
jgi:hypothetical protein